MSIRKELSKMSWRFLTLALACKRNVCASRNRIFNVDISSRPSFFKCLGCKYVELDPKVSSLSAISSGRLRISFCFRYIPLSSAPFRYIAYLPELPLGQAGLLPISPRLAKYRHSTRKPLTTTTMRLLCVVKSQDARMIENML